LYKFADSFADSFFVVGTSYGNVHLLQPVGECDLASHALQRTQLTFRGFFQTINQLIRGKGTDLFGSMVNRPVNQVHIVPVSNSADRTTALLCVGNTLSIWDNWSVGAGAEFCSDYDLLMCLTQNLESSGVSYTNRLCIVDSVIVEGLTPTSSDSVLLCVMCSVSLHPTGAAQDGNANKFGSLYLFTLSVNVSSVNLSPNSKTNVCEVVGRLFIDDYCVITGLNAVGVHVVDGSQIYVHWFALSLSDSHVEAQMIPSNSDDDTSMTKRAKLRMALFDVAEMPTSHSLLTLPATVAALINAPSIPTIPTSAVTSTAEMRSGTYQDELCFGVIRAVGKVDRVQSLFALKTGA
jgi:hypothetical protein